MSSRKELFANPVEFNEAATVKVQARCRFWNRRLSEQGESGKVQRGTKSAHQLTGR